MFFLIFLILVLEANPHYRFTFVVTKNGSASLRSANSVEYCPMTSSKMPGFCKNEDCPSSNELLEFQNDDLARVRGSEIRRHLATCDFCEAEVEFYSIYPQAQDDARDVAAQIPAPLYELAEALLKNRHSDPSSLNTLLKEKPGVVIDKV